MGTFKISSNGILRKCSTFQTDNSTNAILPGLSVYQHLFAPPDSHVIKP